MNEVLRDTCQIQDVDEVLWVPVDMIEKIKSQATREKRTASVILREMLGRHLKDR